MARYFQIRLPSLFIINTTETQPQTKEHARYRNIRSDNLPHNTGHIGGSLTTPHQAEAKLESLLNTKARMTQTKIIQVITRSRDITH